MYQSKNNRLSKFSLIEERIDLNKNNLYNLFKSSIRNGIRMVLLIKKNPILKTHKSVVKLMLHDNSIKAFKSVYQPVYFEYKY